MTPSQRIRRIVDDAQQIAGGRAALAARLHVTPNAITEWRKGRATPSAPRLLRLLDLLHSVRGTEYTFWALAVTLLQKIKNHRVQLRQVQPLPT